ncbi:hypothetical protein J6590_056633 [Homalodisca vitripennis]|nr:hypothetical protein J6590_056633 [Homalodisca vitripennis]
MARLDRSKNCLRCDKDIKEPIALIISPASSARTQSSNSSGHLPGLNKSYTRTGNRQGPLIRILRCNTWRSKVAYDLINQLAQLGVDALLLSEQQYRDRNPKFWVTDFQVLLDSGLVTHKKYRCSVTGLSSREDLLREMSTLGLSSGEDLLKEMSTLGLSSGEDLLREMSTLGLSSGEDLLKEMSTLGLSSGEDLLKEMSTLGLSSGEDLLREMSKLGLSSREDLLREMSTLGLLSGEDLLVHPGDIYPGIAAKAGLVALNESDTPTFRQPGQRCTDPDVKFASPLTRISRWRVVEEYTGVDQQYIVFGVYNAQRRVPTSGEGPQHWKHYKLDVANH